MNQFYLLQNGYLGKPHNDKDVAPISRNSAGRHCFQLGHQDLLHVLNSSQMSTTELEQEIVNDSDQESKGAVVPQEYWVGGLVYTDWSNKTILASLFFISVLLNTASVSIILFNLVCLKVAFFSYKHGQRFSNEMWLIKSSFLF